MNKAVATYGATLACVLAFGFTIATADAAEPFAPGKDGRPHIVAAAPPAALEPRVADYRGIWQDAQPGWAIAFAPHGDELIATLFTYDADGSPIWLAMIGYDVSQLVDTGAAPHTLFAGELFRPFVDADANVTLRPYGPAVVEFAGANDAVLQFNIDGVWREKVVARAYAGDTAPACSASASVRGLWTERADAAAYAGGIHVAQHGDIVVATWFTFDARGEATWRVMSAARTAVNEYAGTMYQARGPVLTAFDPAQVAVTPVGSVTLAVTDADRAELSYVVDGAPAVRTIARHSIGRNPVVPVQLCH